MKPWERVDEARAPNGEVLLLRRRGDEYVITVDGKSLMSSRMHGSEEALAELGCERARTLPAPAVLVGGLGLGYTLKATLERVSRRASVTVAELVPAIVEWNRGPLAALAGRPLEDPRVEVVISDVVDLLRKSSARFDAILLDVDNGPRGLSQAKNGRLYSTDGLGLSRAALRPGGTLAVWSASDDNLFRRRLRQAGFEEAAHTVRGRSGRGAPEHTIFLGHAPR